MIDPQRRLLLIVLLIAAVVRAAMLWGGWDNLREDPDAYTAIAQTLAQTGVFGLTAADGTPTATAFRPPLYPAILSGLSLAIIAVSGDFADPLAVENLHAYRVVVAALHWLLGLLTVAATYHAASHMLRRHASLAGEIPLQRAAAIAALLVAIDPILLQSSTRVMTETLATALAALALLAWALLAEQLQPAANAASPAQPNAAGRRLAAALALGVILGLAYLCRPTFIVWTALLAGYLAAWAVLARRLRPLGVALPLVLATVVLVGGWTLRNHRHFGQAIWATTHGGYTLLLGNNPPFYRYLQERSLGIAWNPQFFFDRWEDRTLADPREPEFWAPERTILADQRWQETQPGPGEVAQDRLAYETAKMTIRHDPNGFVRACLYRVSRLWSPLPLRHGGPVSAAIVAVTIFYSVVMLSVMLGLIMLRRQLLQPTWAASLCLVLALVAVHAVYWTDMRMRAPAIPVLAMLAAVPLHSAIVHKRLSARVPLN